jgi:hypothetical protein
MGTGSFLGIKQPGSGVDHPANLAMRMKEEYSYTSPPSLGLRGLFWGELYLYLFLEGSTLPTRKPDISTIQDHYMPVYIPIHNALPFTPATEVS